MNWVGKCNPALVEAIIASFRNSPEHSSQLLSQFTSKDWVETEPWLDNSGLTLYFFDRVRSLGISVSVDERLLCRMEQKHADNKTRVTAMLQEFVEINRAFQGAGISYANLKGFTLAPDSCPDLSLRHQSDYDFLIAPGNLNAGRALLEARGYVLTGSTPNTLEFKIGSASKISLEGRYKALPTRSVELHTLLESKEPNLSGSPDPRLGRLREWRCSEGEFPALSSADQLIGQALHILGHLRTEHTRLSWLLEYRHHVMSRRDDSGFWKDVAALAADQPDVAIAFGLSTMLAADVFDAFSSPELDAWTVDVLPQAMKLWAERYGRRAVLANVPGTKLFLFLNDALEQARPTERPVYSALRLVPLRLPPRILRAPKHDTFRLRLQREVAQLQYIWYRLRFHVKEGVLHAIEKRTWDKLMKQSACESRRAARRHCAPCKEQ